MEISVYVYHNITARIYIDNITWCFQYPPWYLAEVPSICPRPKAEGKYGTEAKYRADTENTRKCGIYYIPGLYLSDFFYNKISPRQTRHTNPGGLHVMT